MDLEEPGLPGALRVPQGEPEEVGLRKGVVSTRGQLQGQCMIGVSDNAEEVNRVKEVEGQREPERLEAGRECGELVGSYRTCLDLQGLICHRIGP